MASTSVPSAWTVDLASLENYSGYDLISSEYDTATYNNVTYYGRYFVYFTEPKEPEKLTYPTNINTDGTVFTADTASVIVSWRGVGDSNRMEIQFYPVDTVPTAPTDYLLLSAITNTAQTITSTGWESPTREITEYDNPGKAKDHTLVLDPDTGLWHLIYIDNTYDWNANPQGELWFGHATSPDMITWTEHNNINLKTYPYSYRHMWAPHEQHKPKDVSIFIQAYVGTTRIQIWRHLESVLDWCCLHWRYQLRS
jgi:hypothetical protein